MHCLFVPANVFSRMVSESLSESECDLIRRIVRVVPFKYGIPRRKARFTGDCYSLHELVQDLSSRFTSSCQLLKWMGVSICNT